jgi:hypothetical protein
MITLQQVEMIPEITEGQFRFEDVRLRTKALEIQRKGIFWDRLGAAGTGGLAMIALLAAVGAWMRTGKIVTPIK